jgi:hypothetical protein
MTTLVQEAVDRYLDPHGGTDHLIHRGIAEFGDAGEEARQDRAAR